MCVICVMMVWYGVVWCGVFCSVLYVCVYKGNVYTIHAQILTLANIEILLSIYGWMDILCMCRCQNFTHDCCDSCTCRVLPWRILRLGGVCTEMALKHRSSAELTIFATNLWLQRKEMRNSLQMEVSRTKPIGKWLFSGILWALPSGNDWHGSGKSPMNGGFSRKISYKWLT